MPKRRISRSCSSGSAFHRSCVPNSTSPRAGAMRPTRCFKSVLLPQPLPPMMMKMSPRRMVKLRSCWMTKLPYAMSRSRTVMWASAVSGMTRRLDAEHVGEHGEDAVGDDDEDDPGNSRRGRGKPDRRRAAPALNAAEAAGNGHEDAEHRALRNADREVGEVDAVHRLVDVFGHRQVQHADCDDPAADDAHQVAIDAEQRHHQDKG